MAMSPTSPSHSLFDWLKIYKFQVIKARFGRRTHLVFCCFAFFTNLIVMMSLTIAGTAVLNSLVKDLRDAIQ